MNTEKLNHIAQFPSGITQQDARDLEELTRSFPYFSLPYVLLCHYYNQTKDYRFEDTLQKTALRVADRTWLYNFIHAGEPAVLVAQAQEVGTLDTESDEPISDVEFEHNEPLVSIAPQNQEIVLQDEDDTLLLKPREEGDSLMALQSLFEIDLEPIIPAKETGHVEDDEIFEEISAFDGMNSDTSPTPITVETARASEEDILQGLAKPMITPMDHEDVQESQEIPEITTEPLAVDIPKEETPQTEEKTEPEPPKTIPIASVGYNIEDYYPANKTDEPEEPSDFFSWLSNPKFHPEDKVEDTKEAKKEHNEDLIARFLKTNPSISRPKADFFNPSDVAKKSEHLPDDLATETLANVYLKQGNVAHAIEIYEKLILKFPEKRAYFAGLIEKTKKEHNL